MSEEKIFFDNGHVKVTNSRFIVAEQTHAMNGVTSVASHRQDPNRTGLVVGLLLGVLMIFFGAFLIGFLVAAVCGFSLYKQKATHAVVLRSSSGETEALSSTDGTFIKDVVTALNDAIVHRN
ncbi:DUF6232 family protein [Qipengyuania sp. SS22]|uniref:DUF6232 family protein n=1 Tax=Qipengyuania sp. SS22 TaxID=2979461 RepID=UPI0021E61029|nr:DUF6232 family protein [Qipengyuania sp. SS22]UYH53845.1 DUF6232 family protein [Qipengyuania sp. SS22]